MLLTVKSLAKNDIIAEIQRTADANGGNPLGRERFEKETGIPFHSFIGKYWRRWNDAVKEAGYSPNELNKAYSIPLLCEKLAELTRELGSFPTVIDLRIKADAADDFPTKNCFDRLGNRTSRMSLVLEFCRSNSEYKDVLAIIESNLPNSVLSNQTASEDSKEGFVYLLKTGKFYKIGRTSSVERRAREITVQMPEDLTTVHFIRTDDPAGIESYWHRRFGDKRKNGEWFDLSPSDVSAFKRRKFM